MTSVLLTVRQNVKSDNSIVLSTSGYACIDPNAFRYKKKDKCHSLQHVVDISQTIRSKKTLWRREVSHVNLMTTHDPPFHNLTRPVTHAQCTKEQLSALIFAKRPIKVHWLNLVNSIIFIIFSINFFFALARDENDQ